MKYAYIKPNNAARELRRVTPLSATLPEGGPDAYVAHFAKIAGNDEAIIISTHFIPDADEAYSYKNISAKSYYWYSKFLKRFGNISKKPIGTFFRRVHISIVIFFTLIKFKPSHILCWSSSFSLWATYSACLITRPLSFVYCRHNRLVQKNEPWFRRLTSAVDHWIIKRSSAVVVHGPYLKQQILDLGISANKILEFNWNFSHLYEKENLNNTRAQTAQNGTTTILFIGRLQASKGVFELLDACSERLQNDSSLQLVYAGGGSDLEELSTRVKALGLQRSVTMLGMVPHNELPTVIQKSKIVVTPTRSSFPEGRCMATMEGLVMGVPVIAPDFGPFRFLVHDQRNGLLFKPDNTEDLKEKIFNLIDNQALYNQLRIGALEASREMRKPKENFSTIVDLAFKSRQR
jgi:glycosyltransferase involved in cell wall biosynthesis